MGQIPTPRADALRQMREEKLAREQKRQAEEARTAKAAKPAVVTRSAGAGIIAGSVPAKLVAKKTRPQAKH